jgi:hypothetical protein
MFALLLLAMMVPPVPPPDPERARPLLEFWRAQTITDEERLEAREEGRSLLAREYLVAARIDPHDDLWLSKFSALVVWLQTNEPFAQAGDDERADYCAASRLVGRLSAADLAETRAFFGTPAGRNFWKENRIGISTLSGCYQVLMRQSIDAARVLHAVGLKGPPEWEGSITH